MDSAAIVAFSTLSWPDLPQRQQQLLAGLAVRRRVFYVEEPISNPALGHEACQLDSPLPGLSICRVSTPIRAKGFNGKVFPSFAGTLSRLFRQEQVEAYIAWLYTPLVLPMLQPQDPTLQYITYALHPLPHALVYCCLDDISAFIRSPELLARDAALTRSADLLLAATPTILAQKRALSPHPSAVIACFDQAAGAAPGAEAIDQLLASTVPGSKFRVSG